MTTSPSPVPSTPLIAKTPEDLLALAPVVLGFWPNESVVMLTFGATRPFHARLTLPPLDVQSTEVLDQVAQALIDPAQRYGTQALVFLYFTADLEAATRAHEAIDQVAQCAGIRVVVAVCSDGAHYRELGAGAPGHPVPYDVSIHPFIVEALVTGRLTHRTRDDMVASLDTDEPAARAVREALDSSGFVEGDPPCNHRSIRFQGRWVAGLVHDGVASGRVPTDEEVARLLWAVQALRVRDAAWSLITMANAAGHERWWRAILARSPESLAAAPAALLGWSCWQAGDGARAWAAIDRCRAADPGYTLADYLASILENAVPPDFWEGGFDWELGLSA